jgi:hypothetical protein
MMCKLRKGYRYATVLKPLGIRDVTRLLRIAPFAIVACLAAAPASATEFLKAIDDVPLAEGLTESGEAVVFESDFGRVVQTNAVGQISAEAVERFYVETLPAMGWTRIAGAALVFERESERLTITIAEPRSERAAKVSFDLVVKLASTRLPG